MNSKLTILFYISKRPKNKKEKSVLICRLTFMKSRKQFSTGLFINSCNWKSKQQRVEPPEPDSKYINTQLSLIRQQLNQAFLFLQVKGTPFTVLDIYKQYKGETPKDEVGVMQAYHLHSDRIKKLIGIDIKLVTYQKYLESGKHLQDFIKHEFGTKDIHLKALKNSFLGQYEYFLKTEKNLAQSTLNKAIQRFRKVIMYAISEDYLNKDPFLLYKYRTTRKEVVFLTVDELQKLEKHTFEIARIERVKDLFVFCCYTGLAYKEMASIKKDDIVKEFDNELWLQIKRSKTNKAYKVPLLPTALAILDKYKDEDSVFAFKNISNQRFNGYLKEIATIVGLDKNLTHHIDRKTFATTVLLYNDVPMEIVSKLLGHSKMQTTQDHYGEIVERRVSEEMKKLSDKF
ncbi:MAG: site-specific integrase [Flavobacteriaceae bacterium]|nr:site-specific integrase [Flavobacteriaceae bacterium]